ncbi:MAG TPA: GNAT family N-acetyltransferase [Actinomycetota bacterium]|nr:GNAT family N-acetyltransferase [Actinomycetota bacterium]
MRIVFSDDGRDFQRRDWSHLVQADPSGTFFHRPAYLKLYWEEFGETPEHLLLAFAEGDDGAFLAAVAFERVGETLRFLGGTEVTDYMGPVGIPEARDEAAAQLLGALAARGDWADADLRGLAEDDPWLAALRAAAPSAGFAVEETEDQNGVAPYLALPGSWEGYLAALPSKLRHEIKRKANKLEAEAGPFRIVAADAASIGQLLDRFVELHRLSEGPKGVFMVPGMEIFFRRLAEAFLPPGIFRLTFIEVGGELAAGTIGFVDDGTSFLYNSAFDRRWGVLAPGMVLVAEDIRIAIEEGCGAFDLLKGDYAYKYRFGAVPRRVRRLLLTRR